MKYKNHRLRDAISFALIAGTAASTSVAFAQEATDLDRIQITGSRISQATLETAQPVVIVTRADIQKQGGTSVADMIGGITATGTNPPFGRAAALAAGEEAGGSYVDLRNLGPQRTLVLIDGKRMGISSGGYSDLASIPTSIVERIEVLTDGASAIYGSDAIAGVINIITRKNFDGLEASAFLGQYGQGDGQKQSYNFLIGAVGERSSIALGAEYTKEDPVRARDRRFSAYPNGPFHPRDGWSAISQYGTLIDGSGQQWTVNRNGDPRNFADYHQTTADDRSNTNEQMWLQTEVERRSVFANASFDLTDNVRFVTDVLYTLRESTSQIAGYPYRSAMYGTPMSADSYFNPTPGVDVDFMRRGWEVPRQTTAELTTYRFTGGFEGTFNFLNRDWDWDVGYVYNQNKGVQTGTGNFFTPNVAAAVGPSFLDTADGVVKCGAVGAPIAGCIPWNPLASAGMNVPGSLSDPDLQRYLYMNSHDTSKTTTHVYSANIGGSLVELPAGDLRMAAGYEHRREAAEYNPDALKQSGLSTDLAGSPTKGRYSLDEFYLEFQIPILADVFLAKELSLGIAGRYSDYDSFGSTTNSKFNLTWRPVEDLLFRGSYATGFRAPTVDDLWGGSSQTFDKLTDPCDTSFGSAARNPAVAARCTAAGVPGGFRQEASGGVPAAGPGDQSNYPFISTSNDRLQPETSKSYNLGLVYSPRAIQGLGISLDWWKIKIKDVIQPESVTSILNQCYVLGIASACNRFYRDPVTGQVVDATRSLVNAGYQDTAGYDFGVNYRLLDTALGDFNIGWKTTYVDYQEFKSDNENTTPVEQINGWSDSTGVYFRIRSTLNVDWSYGDFGINWTMRYYSGAKEFCTYASECTRTNFSSPYTLAQPLRDVGSNTFHDIQVRYNTPWNATIALGANNVFNHQGPIMYSQPGSSFSYYGGFDIGRFVYLKYQQRF
ncbi:MAG: TonB-dependent receptor [Xanthomonadaceae bacterium]|jgi:iron complex outermembrane receptor protein|nr:TonB-dependent receptor [Xanthomonadaceae bacterium]